MTLKTNLLIITLFPLIFGCSTVRGGLCFVLFIRYLPITAILMTSPDQRIFSSSPGLMYLTVGGGGNGKDSRNVGLKYLCDTGTGNTISSHPSGGNSSQLWNSVSTNRDWRYRGAPAQYYPQSPPRQSQLRFPTKSCPQMTELSR